MTQQVPQSRLSEDQLLSKIIGMVGKKYDEALEELGHFNLAIFGKTGAGKSTLLNAVFGENVAPSGLGRPVTAGLTFYRKSESSLGIYDSRGFETGESAESLMAELTDIVHQTRQKPLAEHIHVAWYVVRWTDRRMEDGQLELIKHLVSLRLPVIFVLTQVPRKNGQLHPEAVEFAQHIESLGLPITPPRVHFTNAKADAFEGYPVHGLHELLESTFQVAPEAVHAALTAAQQIDLERKRAAARAIVSTAVAAAGVIGASPIPFSDAVLLVPAQVGMIAKIAATYGLNIPSARLGTLAASVVMAGGAAGIGRFAVSGLLKLIPGVGTITGAAISGTTAALLTGAIGRGWMRICEQILASGGTEIQDFDKLKEMFKVEVERDAQEQVTANH
ncbi:DUF697 domain-containing protein [Catellatospora sp. KI3]|uniref:YcjF family protein n=1 Tax=Catellatospora sp. KI3 TaxID=3041620 RepID=UPI0024828E0B|nr:DUF697 domain-containing protein [Catellatospora sp. KI3]MDI1462193.1 DUF697 domain-containing protein [Catellatospora sp. KI3]